MENAMKLTEIVRWKGMMAESGVMVRRFTMCALVLACITCVITQWGYVGLQFLDGSTTYLIFMLVPVALAAVLLGTLSGAAVGLLGGAALYVHAFLMPLDYYELVYVNPVTSFVAMALCGLTLGLLFAVILSGKVLGWRRTLLFVLACLVASCVFSVACALGYDWPTMAAAGEFALESSCVQAVGDTVIMAAVSLACLAIVEHAGGRVKVAGLRALFGARLLAVVLVSFAVVAMAAYWAVTSGAFEDSSDDMRGEAEYLLGQVQRTAAYNGKVHEALLDFGDASPESLERFDQVTYDGLLSDILAGYTEDKDGLVIAYASGHVIGTNVDRLGDDSNDTLEAYLDEDALAAAERSIQDGTLERVIYFAPSIYNDLVHVALPDDLEELESMLSPQVGYLVAAESDGYGIIMIRSTSTVFVDRDAIAGWITFASLALLIVVSVLAWRLLNQMVTRRVDAANAALARITDGDLKARVQPGGALEFVELSAGINRTVDALQGWIAEAESRMDAELATAKAIQESALPQVFPPYPDIMHFDIYASMNAAKEVGGDFYDFFLIGDESGPDAGKLAFVMADVSGKGVPAALFMMKAKTQIRDYLEAGMELGEAIENVNRQLVDGNEAGMFVTAWVGVLDYGSGRVDYVNAGHNPPLVWQSVAQEQDDSVQLASWRWLTEKSGIPLGLFEDLPYMVYSVECVPGDTFLLYTDGVTEAMNLEGELYGEDRLEALVNEDVSLHPRALVTRVRTGVAAHAVGAEQSDDITILALEVGVPPEEKVVLVVPADTDELDRVNDFIHAELDRRLCPVRAQRLLDVAVEELFVNVCNYAYEGQDPDVPRTVRVTQAISVEPPSITVELIDGGVPFDPLAKPDTSMVDELAGDSDEFDEGLGILLAKKIVDEMRYERIDGCNVVTLVKRW